MIDWIESILVQKNCSIEESLFLQTGSNDFWHSTILDQNKVPLSGGFGSSRMIARKIAIAEFLERSKYKEICLADDVTQKQWGIHLINSACGFAAGFTKPNTVHRSVCEAAERWVMSQWIDNHYFIDELPMKTLVSELDPVSRFMIEQFDEVRFFKKTVLVPFPLSQTMFQINVFQTMGLKDQGIFPGSSAQLGSSPWQHALLESFRHLLLVRNNFPIEKFPDNKIRFFSQNASVGIQAIEQAKIKQWPTPKVKFHKVDEFQNGQYFIARTILDGWTSWNEGPLERFLY